MKHTRHILRGLYRAASGWWKDRDRADRYALIVGCVMVAVFLAIRATPPTLASPDQVPSGMAVGNPAGSADPNVTDTPPAASPELARRERIEALRTADPSSQGYTDADRAFLRDHGVSPVEARAAEEAAARAGYRE